VCQTFFQLFFREIKKKRGATDAHPLKADVNKTGEGGKESRHRFLLFSGVHTPLNLIRAQSKKKKKSQTGN
jgi:hypothetical protein